jgi:dienelactone hydrolase
MASSIRYFLVAWLLAPFVVAEPAAWIGGHYCTVYNVDAPSIIVLFHGYLNKPDDYYPLGHRLAAQGYAVVIPRDCNGVDALARASEWGPAVASAVRDWGAGRKVAVIGHSMGGSAAMAAAKFTPGLSAYVAMHPAPILSGISFAKVNGPILFTTGTADGGTFAGSTSPSQALNSYNAALLPKALVNVKGDQHWSSIQASEGSMEWAAVNAWLGCFVKEFTKDCEWITTAMCKDGRLAWCYHFGVSSAVAMKAVHV